MHSFPRSKGAEKTMTQTVARGFAAMAAGLFAKGLSSLLERFVLLGSATDVTAGFFDGLAAISFLVAIPLFIRGARTSERRR